MKQLLILAVLLTPFLSYAQSMKHFYERFEVQTNKKNERIIVDKTIRDNVSIEVYIRNLASYLQKEQLQKAMALPNCKAVVYENSDPELVESFEKAFAWMQKTNIGGLLTGKNFISFLKKLEGIGSELTKDPDYAIMANLDNPTYFYKQEFGKFLGDKLKGLIKSQLELAPYVKILKYITDDYSRWIANKKIYHQNILSFYLENVRAQDLGLSESDVGRALSSIHDSRLSFGFSGRSKSKKIKKDFEGYGLQQLEKGTAAADKRYEKHRHMFTARLEKYTASFSLLAFEGSPLVMNLSYKKDKTNDEPTLTYDKDCPNFVYEMRKSYELVRVALGMSPIPYSSKLFTLMKAKYQSQALSEGALVGYLEYTQHYKQLEQIQKQSMNPLL